MKNKSNIYLLALAVLFYTQLWGQNTAQQSLNERVHVHTSQQLLFSGETFWFSIYTSGLPQENCYSSIVLVELLNTDNASVLRKKVQLNEGSGNSYFELPNTLESGSYNLVVYTQWMKNFGKESFFRTELSIINPDKALKNKTKSVPVEKNRSETLKHLSRGKREQIKLSSLINTTELQSGRYSVSIRRKEPGNLEIAKQTKRDEKELEEVHFLPDYQGIIVSGTLLNSANNTVENEAVLLSLPGAHTELLQSITNNSGKFYFKLPEGRGNRDLVFTLPNKNMKIKLEDPFAENLTFTGDKTTKQEMDELQFFEEKYFFQQLKQRYGFNAHSSVKTQKPELTNAAFYTQPNRIIRTNEYVKLDSLSEYFYELIPSVQFKQKKGNHKIVVTNQENKIDVGPNPGVFVDGVYFSEYNNLANIPVEKVDRIEIIWEKYYYKDFTFDGIVSIYTRKSDFYSIDLQENMTRIIYPLANTSEIQFQQKTYTANTLNSRVPDLRYLLLWEPEVSQRELSSLNFFTSDVGGNYELRILGRTDTGEFFDKSIEFDVD